MLGRLQMTHQLNSKFFTYVPPILDIIVELATVVSPSDALNAQPPIKETQQNIHARRTVSRVVNGSRGCSEVVELPEMS